MTDHPPLLGDFGEGRRPLGPNIVRVGLVLVVAFVVLAAGAGYWQVSRSTELSTDPANPAVAVAQREVVRGLVLDRDGRVLARNATTAGGESYRVYPDGSVSPMLGYASSIYGSGGLERALDAQLTGVGGPDPVQQMLRKFQANPYDPADVRLSISLPLQQRAVSLLGRDRGSVVMLDPATGQVLAMASTPTYNASAIANPATAKSAWQAVTNDAGQPLLDRAIQGLYVPGSVLKILTAIAAIGSGTITPATTYANQPGAEKTGLLVSGFRVVDGHHDFAYPGQALNFDQATEVSCNIYYAETGLKVGGAQLRTYADLLGFDGSIPFNMPGGATLATAVSRLNDGSGSFGGGFRDSVELANAAYGQAATQVTPLQMALIAAAVGNDGLLMKPQLVLSEKTRAGTANVDSERLRDVLAPDQAAEIRLAMQQAVEGRYGKLFTTGAAVAGVPTAGKSGTAQLGGSGEPNSWFIGFAPVDHPRVAIAVVVEHGGSGAVRASPIAGDLMSYYLKTILAGR